MKSTGTAGFSPPTTQTHSRTGTPTHAAAVATTVTTPTSDIKPLSSLLGSQVKPLKLNVQVSSFLDQHASELTGLAASAHSGCYHLQDVCHWALQVLTGNNNSKWLYCQSTVSLKMISLVFRHSNFYKKRDVKMGFAVMCSSTHEVFMHILKYRVWQNGLPYFKG